MAEEMMGPMAKGQKVGRDNDGISAGKRKRVSARERFERLMKEDICAEDILTTFKLIRVIRSVDTCIRWLQDVDLLIKNMVCPSEGCRGQVMEMIQSDSLFLVDEYWCFHCSNCESHRSVREGSFFENQNLCLPEELVLIVNFLKLVTESDSAIDQCMEQHIVEQHYGYFRDICIVWSQEVLENSKFYPEEAIEVNESLFIRKVKYGVNKKRELKMWVFGMLGRDSGKVIAYLTQNRRRETVIPLILKHTTDDNLIIHDDLPRYQSLSYDRDHAIIISKGDFKGKNVKIIKKGGVSGGEKTLRRNQNCHKWTQLTELLETCDGVSLNMLPGYLAHILFMMNNPRTEWCREFMNILKKMYIGGNLRVRKPVFLSVGDAAGEACDDADE